MFLETREPPTVPEVRKPSRSLRSNTHQAKDSGGAPGAGLKPRNVSTAHPTANRLIDPGFSEQIHLLDKEHPASTLGGVLCARPWGTTAEGHGQAVKAPSPSGKNLESCAQSDGRTGAMEPPCSVVAAPVRGSFPEEVTSEQRPEDRGDSWRESTQHTVPGRGQVCAKAKMESWHACSGTFCPCREKMQGKHPDITGGTGSWCCVDVLKNLVPV